MNWLKSRFILLTALPFMVAGYLFEAARSGFNAGVSWRKSDQDWFVDN